MEQLLVLNLSAQLIQSVYIAFKCSLYQHISRNNRLVGLKGARGTGKTTLLLQNLKI